MNKVAMFVQEHLNKKVQKVNNFLKNSSRELVGVTRGTRVLVSGAGDPLGDL